MKQEEIIIDGVNISGCTAYKDKHCRDKTSIMFCDTNLCSNYPYCYYKQLKRLERRLIALEQSEQEGIEIVAELKAENAELKEYEYFYLDKYIDLKQALEKIREKCKRVLSDFGVTNDNTWEYCVIIELINKILDDNEVLK